MTVRIGDVSLTGVQDIRTSEKRNLVEQDAPEQEGNLFQDIGRDPVSVIMEGLIFGSEALENLEKLRTAQTKASPLPFASDVVIGTELTEVIIEALNVRQVAGYENRYRFNISILEHVEPPESQEKADAEVQKQIEKDADAQVNDSIAASSALQNPETIPETIKANPGALDQMSADELSAAMVDNMDDLSPDSMGDIMKSVGENDPSKLGGMLESVKKKGGLAGLIQKFAEAGKSLKKMLSGVDLMGIAKKIVSLVTTGIKLFNAIKKMVEDIKKVSQELKTVGIMSSIEKIVQTSVKAFKSLIQTLGQLVKTVSEIVALLKPKDSGEDSPMSTIKESGSASIVDKILDTAIAILTKIEEGLIWIAERLIELSGLSVFLGFTGPLVESGLHFLESSGKFLGEKIDPGGFKQLEGSVGSAVKETKVALDHLSNISAELFESDIENDLISLSAEFGGLRENLAAFKTGIK